MTHAEIDPKTRTFIRWLRLGPNVVIDTTRVLPAVLDAVPVYDPATHRLVEGTPVVEANRVRRTWATVALGQATVDRAKLVADSIADFDTALTNWDALTAANQKAVLKRVIQILKAALSENRIDLSIQQ